MFQLETKFREVSIPPNESRWATLLVVHETESSEAAASESVESSARTNRTETLEHTVTKLRKSKQRMNEQL